MAQARDSLRGKKDLASTIEFLQELNAREATLNIALAILDAPVT